MLLTGVVFVLRIAFHGVLLWITIGCDNFAYFCEYVVVTPKACTEKNEFLSYCLGYRLETGKHVATPKAGPFGGIKVSLGHCALVDIYSWNLHETGMYCSTSRVLGGCCLSHRF